MSAYKVLRSPGKLLDAWTQEGHSNCWGLWWDIFSFKGHLQTYHSLQKQVLHSLLCKAGGGGMSNLLEILPHEKWPFIRLGYNYSWVKSVSANEVDVNINATDNTSMTLSFHYLNMKVWKPRVPWFERIELLLKETIMRKMREAAKIEDTF